MSSSPSARDRLLLAAAELTYEHGITATGVDAIAERAGVTKRTLYVRFGSKDALVADALRVRHEPMLALLREKAVRRAARAGVPPALALFDVLERLFATDGWRGCAFLNASAEVGDPDHPLHGVVAEHLDGRRALVTELLGDRADLAAAVALLAEGAFAVSAVVRGPAPARDARTAAQRLLEAPPQAR